MSPGIPLSDELLDDFHTESEELLGQMHRHLRTLDEKGDAEAVSGLYRAVHSLKGLCGIAGLSAAESLAHEFEDVLRRMHKGAVPETGVLALMTAVINRLDQILQSHRQHTAAPETKDLTAQLREFAKNQDTEELGCREDNRKAPPAAETKPTGNWLASFRSSHELDAQGINVASIRARLEDIGTILSTEPVIGSDGTVSFRFAMRIDPSKEPGDPEIWTAVGVSLTPVEGDTPRSAGESIHGESVSKRWIRVDMDRLDELMRIAGELSIQRARLFDRLERMQMRDETIVEINANLTRSLRNLREAVSRARLVATSELFTRLPSIVREASRESGKRVRLVVSGSDTEMDKYVIDRLKEPLLHLVRNAVSHGFEAPPEREKAGKSPEATLRISASEGGGRVTIEVEDDGRGLEVERIIQRARALGIATPDGAARTHLLSLITRDGFSTRERADLTSGRGVGMAVVADTVRELGGVLSVESEAGLYTRFILELPLSLSITDAIVTTIGGQPCAIPRDFVDTIVQIAPSKTRMVNGREVMPYRDGLLPLIRMSGLFGEETHATRSLTVMVIRSNNGASGLVVDVVHSEREIVVRPMTDPLVRVPGIAGATELGDGKPVLILDAPYFCSSDSAKRTGERCA